MKDDLVSAIITTCKREPKIVRRALMSTLNQTYNNLEILVVDDSPDSYEQRDNIQRMVEEIQGETDRKIRYIRHDECRGACEARNTGLQNSSGEFVAFLDDDDEWLPYKIEEQICKMDSDRVALVYCNNEKVNEIKDKSITVVRKKHRGKVYESLIFSNFVGSTSYPLIRKKALVDIGGFDPLMQSSQDYDVWLRLAQRYEVEYVDNVLVRYYVHAGEQITKNPQKKVNGLERLNEKNKEYLAHHKNAYWVRYMKIIPFYLKNNQKVKAWATWFKCVIKCPQKVRGNWEYLKQML